MVFLGLLPIGERTPKHQELSGPGCQWDGCEETGMHRARVGRVAGGLFLLFCQNRVAKYSEGYNFSPNLSDPVTARYQSEADTGLEQLSALEFAEHTFTAYVWRCQKMQTSLSYHTGMAGYVPYGKLSMTASGNPPEL